MSPVCGYPVGLPACRMLWWGMLEILAAAESFVAQSTGRAPVQSTLRSGQISLTRVRGTESDVNIGRLRSLSSAVTNCAKVTSAIDHLCLCCACVCGLEVVRASLGKFYKLVGVLDPFDFILVSFNFKKSYYDSCTGS